MNEIWTRRLIAGTKTWDEMPASRQPPVRILLGQRVEDGTLTAERYKEITGGDYKA